MGAAVSKRVTVLGSTGSIGQSTLDLITRSPEDFSVVALTAGRNVARLAEQARAVRAELAVIADSDGYAELKERLAGSGVASAAGDDAVIEAAGRPSDLVVAGIVGAAGLPATLAAVRRGAAVAFANKECLVSAGDLMLAEVARHGATLLPVDSEHNAIFQVFDATQRDAVERLILTASGGPFRAWSLADMASVTPTQAVAHPNWSMGAKISVDSATMMNKGLEVIEARYLFAMPSERIEVLVHPQSVIHSMVAYVDGSVLAQLGSPDMRTPIAHALAYPKRMATPAARLDFAKLATLTFEAPDPQRFPALRVSRAALQSGGGAPTILNAANEVAVAAFLAGEIGFLDIVAVVEDVLDRVTPGPIASLDDVFGFDLAGRRSAREAIADRRRAAASRSSSALPG